MLSGLFWDVWLWDLERCCNHADPQASATMWASAAVRAGDLLPFAVEPYSGAPRAKSGELLLIDTPPGQADVLQEVLDCVDVAIVPTAASPMDLERVWPRKNLL